jgi:multiple sugar transport system ATP-binding protein
MAGGSTLSLPLNLDDLQAGESVTVGIRPDHVTVDPTGPISGRIALVEELGENHLLYVDTEHGPRLTARAPGNAKHRIGERVSVTFDAQSCHLFKASGEALAARGSGTTPAGSSPRMNLA